jgi:hypothetical protein
MTAIPTGSDTVSRMISAAVSDGMSRPSKLRKLGLRPKSRGPPHRRDASAEKLVSRSNPTGAVTRLERLLPCQRPTARPPVLNSNPMR